jgi:hypothetical protein
MTSAAQVEANRSNATHSTGPATSAGKAVSRLNATRHGLTSQVACMSWEDRNAFNDFCAALVAHHRPEGSAETQLAQAIAEESWRLNRARAIEHNIFALGSASPNPGVESDDPQIDAALSQARTFRDEAKTFGLLTLYEQRIHRNLQRSLDRLQQMQQQRRADRAQALDELVEIKEYRRIRKLPDPPASGEALAAEQQERSGLIPTEGPQATTALVSGFVFSPEEIDFAAFRRGRANLVAEALTLVPRRSARPYAQAA